MQDTAEHDILHAGFSGYDLIQNKDNNVNRGFTDIFFDMGIVQLRPLDLKNEMMYSIKDGFEIEGKIEGVSMLGISDAAESIGFRTKGYRLTWEQLRDEVPLPCIVHWRQRHFVVVYDIKTPGKFTFPFGRGPGLSKKSLSDDKKDERTIVYVADPAQGLLKYTKKELLKCWLSTRKSGEREGTALLLEPTPDFYRQEDEQKGKRQMNLSAPG